MVFFIINSDSNVSNLQEPNIGDENLRKTLFGYSCIDWPQSNKKSALNRQTQRWNCHFCRKKHYYQTFYFWGQDICKLGPFSLLHLSHLQHYMALHLQLFLRYWQSSHYFYMRYCCLHSLKAECNCIQLNKLQLGLKKDTVLACIWPLNQAESVFL